MSAKPPMHVGWREWVRLRDLCNLPIKAKIDTGARTSAIHAWKIEPFQRNGEEWVRFDLHPNQNDDATIASCEAPVFATREVRSSNGENETRIFIKTNLSLGGRRWPVEISLTRRDEMGFRMLVGRRALRKKALVDPSTSFLHGQPDG